MPRVILEQGGSEDNDTLGNGTFGVGGDECFSAYAPAEAPPNPPRLPSRPPPGPEKRALTALKEPACHKTKGHTKCKEAFQKERKRADYAATQATQQSEFVRQYHTSLKGYVDESQPFMKKQQRQLAAKSKELSDLTSKHVEQTSKLNTALGRVKELESDIKELNKEKRSGLKEERKKLENEFAKKERQLDQQLESNNRLLEDKDRQLKEKGREIGDLRKELASLRKKHDDEVTNSRKLSEQLNNLRFSGSSDVGGKRSKPSGDDIAGRMALSNPAVGESHH